MMFAQSAGILVLLTALGPIAQSTQAQASAQPSAIEMKAPSENARQLRDQPARLTVHSVPVAVALMHLSDRSGVPVAFSRTLMPPLKLVTCVCNDLTIQDALSIILDGLPFVYAVDAGQVVITPIELFEPERARPARLTSTLVRHAPAAMRRPGRITFPQDTVVDGAVVDATTGGPLQGVQVVVEGTDQGATTNAQGQFRISGIQGDSVTLRFVMLGYRTVTETVDAGSEDLRIELAASAIELDALVVTGTAGATQRRTLGNTLVQLDATELMDVAPVADMQGLLKSRAPGVLLQQGSGGVGMGSRIRLRGQNSLLLDQQPLIYVDGIRVDNSIEGGRRSRFDDLNPNEIESIEIVKGPAAATLYGTEASAGVIQIITKRGTEGPPQIDVQVGQGVMWINNPASTVYTNWWRFDDGRLEGLNLYANDKARGLDPYRYGRMEQYLLQISGGSPNLRYFAAADFDRSSSVIIDNDKEQWNFRTNLTAMPSDKLTLSANMGFVTSNVEYDRLGLTSSMAAQLDRGRPFLLDTPTRGWQTVTPEVWRKAYDQFEDLNRLTTSFQANHWITPWLEQRATIGIDIVNRQNLSRTNLITDPVEVEMLGASTALGSISTDVAERRRTTLDYGITSARTVGSSVALRTSVGLQYSSLYSETVSSSGEQFAGPGLNTVSATAIRSGGQTYEENSSVGLYIQQEFQWNERRFLTAAIRADDNSAFGEDFTFVTYPKVSASWVLSEEPFFNLGLVDLLRLRIAYGAAGRAPGAFDALRTFSPQTGRQNQAAVTPDQKGNPDLAPERSEEIEAGFEVSLLNSRLGIDFSYYSQTTRDVIVSRQNAPSSGFPGSTLVNAGAVSSKGVEVALTGQPTSNLDVALNLSHNNSRVVHLGGLGDIRRHTHLMGPSDVPGYAPGSYYARRVVGGEFDGNGIVVNYMCDGGTGKYGRDVGGDPVPCGEAPSLYMGNILAQWEGGMTADWRPLSRIRIHALVDFEAGKEKANQHRWIRCTGYIVCLENHDPTKYDPAYVAEVQNGGNQDLMSRFYEDASYIRFRELSMTYDLPETLLGRWGLSRSSLTVGARNLAVWTRWGGADPEALSNIGSGGAEWGMAEEALPIQLKTTLRVTF